MVTIFSIHDKFCVSYSSKFLFRVCVQKVADFAVLEGAAVAVQADKVATPPPPQKEETQAMAITYSIYVNLWQTIGWGLREIIPLNLGCGGFV